MFFFFELAYQSIELKVLACLQEVFFSPGGMFVCTHCTTFETPVACASTGRMQAQVKSQNSYIAKSKDHHDLFFFLDFLGSSTSSSFTGAVLRVLRFECFSFECFFLCVLGLVFALSCVLVLLASFWFGIGSLRWLDAPRTCEFFTQVAECWLPNECTCALWHASQYSPGPRGQVVQSRVHFRAVNIEGKQGFLLTPEHK